MELPREIFLELFDHLQFDTSINLCSALDIDYPKEYFSRLSDSMNNFIIINQQRQEITTLNIALRSMKTMLDKYRNSQRTLNWKDAADRRIKYQRIISALDLEASKKK